MNFCTIGIAQNFSQSGRLLGIPCVLEDSVKWSFFSNFSDDLYVFLRAKQSVNFFQSAVPFLFQIPEFFNDILIFRVLSFFQNDVKIFERLALEICIFSRSLTFIDVKTIEAIFTGEKYFFFAYTSKKVKVILRKSWL